MLRKKLMLLLIFIWADLCVIIFIYNTDLRGGIHLFSLAEYNLNTILPQIADINLRILLIDTFKAFAGAALFAMSTIGVGWTFIKFIDRKTVIRNEGSKIIITAFILGQSLFSFALIFILIAFEQFIFLSIFIIFFFGLFSFFLHLHNFRHFIKKKVKDTWLFFNDRKVLLLVLLSIILFGCTLLFSSSRLGYDAASLYFAQAKMIAISERSNLLLYKDNFAGSTLYLTSVQSALIKLFGDQSARMFSWMNGLAILSLGMMIGERSGLSRRSRLLFLPLAMTTTAFVDLLGDGKIDLATNATILASVYWFLRSMQKPTRFYLFFTGFFSGFAIISKPFNALLLGAFFLLLTLFYIWLAEDKVVFLKSLVFASTGFLLSILFWGISYLIVNDVLLGDPLAPLSNLYLVKNDWPVELTNEQRTLYILFYPFVITYHGIFDAMGFITPFFLAFLPFYLIKEARTFRIISKELIFICISAFFILFLWITAFNSIFIFEVRYVLFLWIFLFLPIAQILDNAMETSLLARAGVQVILAALLFFMIARTFFISLATYSPIDQRGVPHCNDLPMCIFFNPVNQLANPGDRILVLSAFRYYLRPDLLACSSMRDDYIALEQAAVQSPEKFWKEVQYQGYRYVIFDSFFNQFVLRFHNLPDLSTSLPPNGTILYDRTFRDFDLRTITESIYRIEPSSSTSPKTKCTFEVDKWQVQSR